MLVHFNRARRRVHQLPNQTPEFPPGGGTTSALLLRNWLNQLAACGAAVPHPRRPENGNSGTLTRRVPADRVVSAIPPPRGKPKPPQVPRTPRVVEFLRK